MTTCSNSSDTFDIEPDRGGFRRVLDPESRCERAGFNRRLPEIVQMSGTGISLEQAEDVVDLIQKLDPPGVGARDLTGVPPAADHQSTRRCMRNLRLIIGDHLDDLSHNRLPGDSERRPACRWMSSKMPSSKCEVLNPFPGSRVREHAVVRNVTPDLRVVKDDEGNWKVEIVDEYMPSLRISGRYLKLSQAESRRGHQRVHQEEGRVRQMAH